MTVNNNVKLWYMGRNHALKFITNARWRKLTLKFNRRAVTLNRTTGDKPI